MSVRIGPFGSLLAFARTTADIDAPIGRDSSALTLLSGRVVTQKAPRSARSWVLRFPHFTADQLALVLALEQGVYGSDLFMYEPFVAQANMLLPGVARPGLLGDWSECTGVAAGAALTVGGVPIPVTGSVGAATTSIGRTIGGTPAPTPVLPSTQYTGSVYVSASSTVGLRWVDSTGTTISTTTGSASSSRPSQTATSPPNAAGVVLVLTTSGTTRFTAGQLNEGALRSWLPGEGVPAVSLSGVDQSLTWATSSEQRRDLSIRVTEVAARRAGG